MRHGLLVSSAIGLILVGGPARAQNQTAADQNQDGIWDGPGYYLEDLMTEKDNGQQDLLKTGGPFPSLEACQAYWSQNSESITAGQQSQASTYSNQCNYRGSNIAYTSCFLTTACVQYAGLADDCEELKVMRAFRDHHLRRFDEGRLLIDHYYRIAPRIVERIRQAPDRDRVLGWILREVRATTRIIGCGESETAIVRYAAMVSRLQRHYGVI